MSNRPHIVIHTDRDLTPAGKRSIRIVTLRGGQFVRWYLNGRIYATRPLSQLELSREWVRSNPAT